MKTRFTLTAALALTSAAASAQTGLIREGDPAPGGGPGDLVSSISGVAANHQGGYVAVLLSSIGGASISQMWGSFTAGSGSLLRQETTVGNLLQTSFEGFPALSDSAVIYSASCEDTVSLTTGLDTVWSGDTSFAVEEQPVPGSTLFWSFASRPRALRDGTPVYTAGLRTTPTGSTAERGFFVGTTARYFTGDTVPGMPFPITTNGTDFDSRISADGTNDIVICDIDSPSSSNDAAVALSGSGLVVAGTLLREENPIPAALGPIGAENWDSFDFVGVNEAGSYFITGDTDGDTATDEFIFRDGAFFVREGDTVDGQVITGSISHAYMNEAGVLAYIWDIEVGTGNAEALFVEDQMLLTEGDEVDWDGDGTIDAGFTIDDFTGIESLAVGSDGTVYFTADVITPAGELEGLFSIEPDGLITTNYCTALANSTGAPASISGFGSTFVADNNVTLTASGVPPQTFGIFITSMTQGLVPLADGNLCLGGMIGRYSQPGQILQASAAGEFSLMIDLTQTPQGPGLIAINAGESWNFQAWFRDFTQGGANLSNGLEVTFN